MPPKRVGRGIPSLLTASDTSPRSPRVLMVDDNEDNRDLYMTGLTAEGFEMHDARDGREAIERARAIRPDVIVMDLGLPGVDGWAATRRLKADPVTARIPVIALTAHSLDDSRKKAVAAGCDVFCTKPCLPDELAQKIRGVLGRRKKPRSRPRA
ncbi:MAG: response regulator [Candidatus Rokuibacteriota bacterium]